MVAIGLFDERSRHIKPEPTISNFSWVFFLYQPDEKLNIDIPVQQNF